jgi:hypothetical protein
MKEVSPSNYNNGNKINSNISDLKIYPTSFSTKSIPNSVYNINTITKKSNLSNINNNITFKITEKECSDINSIVRKSVEKINDLLNSKEFNNRNFSKTLKRSSKNYFSKENENEKMKSKTIKDTGVKTNFTFNINNFINVPNNKNENENEGINMNKKTERYEEEDELINEQTFSEKNKISIKTKSNQKGNNYTNRSKNNNYGSNTNGHNNNGSGKLFRNCVRKKKLFDDGGVNINYNNNINIVNFSDNKRKNMKTQKFETKEDKDKSITVNTKYKKYKGGNSGTVNYNYINENNNTLNNSIKNKKKEYNNNVLKYSISDDINMNNSKKDSSSKNNLVSLNDFAPNIININSLSDNKNINNLIMNNNNNKNNKLKSSISSKKYNLNNKNKSKSTKKNIKSNENKKVIFKSPVINNNYYLDEKDLKDIKNLKDLKELKELKDLYCNNIENTENDRQGSTINEDDFKKYNNNNNKKKKPLSKTMPLNNNNNPINNLNNLNNMNNLNINNTNNTNSNNSSNTKNKFSKTYSNKNKNKISTKLIPFENLDDNDNYNDSLNNLEENIERLKSINKPLYKKESSNISYKKCGYSSEHLGHHYMGSSTQNIHKILNQIYSKEFPNKVKTNNIMKLMLFLNEYLINNNLLDDYYDKNNREKLDVFSKFLCDKINIDFPQEDDVNIDKMVNSAKKIQRMWRKKKIEKFIGKNSEESELKKMVINKYIRRAGFKVKKIIGLFNTLVEDFNNIGNEHEIEEMFYNIQQIIKRKLTSYEKNNLYKEYINSIIYTK